MAERHAKKNNRKNITAPSMRALRHPTTTMNPPAYTPTAPALVPIPRRSIQDTRALILGNAAIIKPRKRSEEPIELVVAKHKTPQASAEEVAVVSHYAFLVCRKSGEKEIDIILKGKPRDTVEEALEEMLDRTEGLMEEVLLRHGKHAESLGCCIECSRAVRGAG
jgi:hypothetical protein